MFGAARAVELRLYASESWVRRLQQERREHDQTSPRLTRCRTPKWAAEAEEIKATIRQRPDLTMKSASMGPDWISPEDRLRRCSLRDNDLRGGLRGLSTTGRWGSASTCPSFHNILPNNRLQLRAVTGVFAAPELSKSMRG